MKYDDIPISIKQAKKVDELCRENKSLQHIAPLLRLQEPDGTLYIIDNYGNVTVERNIHHYHDLHGG